MVDRRVREGTVASQTTAASQWQFRFKTVTSLQMVVVSYLVEAEKTPKQVHHTNRKLEVMDMRVTQTRKILIMTPKT